VRQKLSEHCLKEVTVKHYENQLKQYLRFMGPAPLVPLWSDKSAALWIFHDMEVRSLKENTLKGRIPAFVYGVFKYTGRQCDSGKDKRYCALSMLSRAIDRLADDVQRKIAVGKTSLTRCFNALPTMFGIESAIQLWAWWTVSFGAMLRCSETVRIKWCDVIFSQEQNAAGVPTAMSITIRALEDNTFKTHQCSVEFKFVTGLGAGICPVSALWGWRSMAQRLYGNLPEAVFTFSVDGVRQAFQQTASTQLGGVPKDYGLHSLRAGAATDAEEEGWSISEIMFMGRWRSPTVLVYLRQGDRWLHELRLPARTGTTVRPTLFRN
jgi:hypothetical protein